MPGINIGHNQDVAWTHTVSTNTTITFWYLTSAGPNKYHYKGKAVAIKTRTVTVEALEHGELVPRTGTLYYSHYGPVIWEGGLRSRSMTPMPTTSGVSTSGSRSAKPKTPLR